MDKRFIPFLGGDSVSFTALRRAYEHKGVATWPVSTQRRSKI
jgi:hypothetical protein